MFKDTHSHPYSHSIPPAHCLSLSPSHTLLMLLLCSISLFLVDLFEQFRLVCSLFFRFRFFLLVALTLDHPVRLSGAVSSISFAPITPNFVGQWPALKLHALDFTWTGFKSSAIIRWPHFLAASLPLCSPFYGLHLLLIPDTFGGTAIHGRPPTHCQSVSDVTMKLDTDTYWPFFTLYYWAFCFTNKSHGRFRRLICILPDDLLFTIAINSPMPETYGVIWTQL